MTWDIFILLKATLAWKIKIPLMYSIRNFPTCLLNYCEKITGSKWTPDSSFPPSWKCPLCYLTCRNRCSQVIKGSLIGYVPDPSTMYVRKQENVWKTGSLNECVPGSSNNRCADNLWIFYCKCFLVLLLKKELRSARHSATIPDANLK